MRTSNDEIKDGHVLNGYDFALQVWVRMGYVLGCGHHDCSTSRPCNAARYAGRPVASIDGCEEC